MVREGQVDQTNSFLGARSHIRKETLNFKEEAGKKARQKEV